MKRILALTLPLLLTMGMAFAHGGGEHVMGTVVKVSTDTIDVKTTKGETKQVMYTSKTTFTKAGATIQASDVKEGDRVVIDVHAMKEMNGMLEADSVKVGSGRAASKEKFHVH